MAVSIVQLGSPRARDEGLRLGTVRRPPRGIAKTEFAKQNYFDVWFPNLAPSPELVQAALSAKNARDWAKFERAFRNELRTPDRTRELDLLAALSLRTNFSLGCYCRDESRCHRSVLRALLLDRGANVVDR